MTGWITDTPASTRFPVYTRSNASDVLPDPISPLGATLSWIPGVMEGWRDGNVRNGAFEMSELTAEGINTNVTLCFSATQALLAAKAGAAFISPFIGRLDDINLDGMELIADIREIYDNYGFETQILAASIRSANHMSDAAKIGADVATAPPDVIKKMARGLPRGLGEDRPEDPLIAIPAT